MITLLLEPDFQERTKLVNTLMHAFETTVYTADTPEQTESHAADLGTVDLLIADVHPGQENDIVALRDRLRQSRPELLIVLLSRSDLTPWFGPPASNEAIFPIPLEFLSVFEWIVPFFPEDVKNIPAPSPTPAQTEPDPSPASLSEENPPAPEAGASESISGSEPHPESEADPAQSSPSADNAAGGPLPVGTILGDYELLEFLSRGASSDRFIALQRSIERRVRLRMLRPDWQASRAAREQFRAESKAQAAVRHPQITTVFEAHETEDLLYYTQELLSDPALDQLISEQRTLPEEDLLRVMKSVAQIYQFLETNGHECQPIWPEHIHLLSDGGVKISNTVTISDPENKITVPEQLINLAKSVHPLMDQATIANETIPNLLYEMAGTANKPDSRKIETWDALLEEIDFIEKAWQDMSHGGITAGRAGLYVGLVCAIAAGLVLLISLGVWVFQNLNRSSAKVPDQLVRIPAGKFIYQDGRETDLGEYWISAYEVTVGQYAEFLDFLEKHPQSATGFDDPRQPSYKKDHYPPNWTTNYKAARQKDGQVRYQDSTIGVSLDSPVTMVDWWDAFAYCKWKSRRLPTELEWEKAARGRQGNVYPWGNELNLTKLNSGVTAVPATPATPDPSASASPSPESSPADDYPFWSPVNVPAEDISHYLVHGMAGNVSEWTADWAPHPTQAGKEVPVERGASFATNKGENLRLTTRMLAEDASDRQLWLGFRTASSTPPSESK